MASNDLHEWADPNCEECKAEKWFDFCKYHGRIGQAERFDQAAEKRVQKRIANAVTNALEEVQKFNIDEGFFAVSEEEHDRLLYSETHHTVCHTCGCHFHSRFDFRCIMCNGTDLQVFTKAATSEQFEIAKPKEKDSD